MKRALSIFLFAGALCVPPVVGLAADTAQEAQVRPAPPPEKPEPRPPTPAPRPGPTDTGDPPPDKVP